MGLPTEAKAKLAGLVRREPVHLPMLGIELQARGLMFGEMARIRSASGFKQDATMIALGTETLQGEPVWNPNLQEDHNEIAQLHGKDVQALAEAIRRLSGVGDDEEKND